MKVGYLCMYWRKSNLQHLRVIYNDCLDHNHILVLSAGKENEWTVVGGTFLIYIMNIYVFRDILLTELELFNF